MTVEANPARRSERSRQATLDAALQLCREHGYGRLTVEAIAARAGVSKKTIYRWWTSKGAVVLDAIDTVVDRSAKHPSTGDLAKDMHTQLMSVVKLLTNDSTGSAFTGVIAEAQYDSDLAGQLRERLIRPRIDEFRDRMRLAQEAGQLADDADLDVALDLFYGPIYHRLAFHLGMPSSKQVRSIVRHVMRALNAPG